MAAYRGVGPGRVLSEAQVTKLIARLEQGLAAAGWIDDQRWTLSRVRTLLGRMFQEPSRCPPCGTGCAAPGSPRNNASAAAERNEQAIAHRRRYQSPACGPPAAGNASTRYRLSPWNSNPPAVLADQIA